MWYTGTAYWNVMESDCDILYDSIKLTCTNCNKFNVDRRCWCSYSSTPKIKVDFEEISCTSCLWHNCVMLELVYGTINCPFVDLMCSVLFFFRHCRCCILWNTRMLPSCRTLTLPDRWYSAWHLVAVYFLWVAW